MTLCAIRCAGGPLVFGLSPAWHRLRGFFALLAVAAEGGAVDHLFWFGSLSGRARVHSFHLHSRSFGDRDACARHPEREPSLGYLSPAARSTMMDRPSRIGSYGSSSSASVQIISSISRATKSSHRRSSSTTRAG